ncbi:MAG: DUF87 domain-containing protein [Bacteroidales bacterium]|nr:DUF87 domain-containing protein [Bacteroidales bacterium]
MALLDELLQSNKLVSLVQKENFVGWVYSIDYENALVVTNDDWKQKVKGIPHNSFLVATSFDPEKFSATSDMDREVILLRVVGTSKLPQDDDMVRTKIDNYQNQTSTYLNDADKDFDNITKNRLQFGGLNCRVLGTFYVNNNTLCLGSDIENFSVSMRLSVFMPKGDALKTIVNYVDPIRRSKAKEDFAALGIEGEIEPFKIGTVRYTSTDRLHRSNENDKVPFYIQPSDFLARRTAVLGMTRTGKSNMIKQTVSVVKDISDRYGLKIGQLIYDINGEYANANQQDSGSISDIYQDNCIRYRMVKTEGFEPILNNFYYQISEGHSIICDEINDYANSSAADVQSFMRISFDEPDNNDRSLHKRWEVKIAIYKTLLYVAGFEISPNYKVKFSANQDIRNKINPSINPSSGLTLSEAKNWFLKARSLRDDLKSSSGNKWLDDDCIAMLNLMACKNSKDSYINGYKVLVHAKPYHSALRNTEVSEEIYRHLSNGKIVILDLSVGNATLREKLSKKIASYLFNASMKHFTDGKTPPNIVVYIEEAHNLIGKGMELTDTWPRLAKEGAKYRIALVYATQEVSSVHPNILANTENWFVSHLNSDREIKELAKFYDFADFSQSLLRSQDVGFSRVKTLSSPYVIPIQIDKFDPERIKNKRG